MDTTAPVPRQFVASCSIYSPKWAAVTGKRATIYIQIGFWAIVLLFVLQIGGPTFGVQLFPHVPGSVIAYGWLASLVVLGLAIGANFLWRWRRKYPITLTSEGLAIGGRHGDVYSLVDAELGLWANMGVALHLRRGRHRFLLGGRDCRIGPATPLNAPPVPLVDAWLSRSDFDALLSQSGRRTGPAAGGSASGDAVRCVTFPNPLLIQQMGPFAFLKKQRLTQSLSQPQLFIDVDSDAIRVIDANSNALIASASLSQVTAAPATYHLGGGHLYPSAENLVSDTAGDYFSTMPAMAVAVPGVQPVTIGCRDFTGLQRRFSWGANVPVSNDPPAYVVSAADWLTLIGKLGLAQRLEDIAPHSPDDGTD
jgi:hypothetical protein